MWSNLVYKRNMWHQLCCNLDDRTNSLLFKVKLTLCDNGRTFWATPDSSKNILMWQFHLYVEDLSHWVLQSGQYWCFWIFGWKKGLGWVILGCSPILMLLFGLYHSYSTRWSLPYECNLLRIGMVDCTCHILSILHKSSQVAILSVDRCLRSWNHLQRWLGHILLLLLFLCAAG